MKKISVVMCCYNAEIHLATAIESILNQSFADFEFIIWDDGSTDNTSKIIKSYTDSRIKYYYHTNTGLGQALRMACDKASAPIIARMDADDFALPNRFEIQYAYLMNHSDTVLISSAVNYMDDEGVILGRSFPYTNPRVIHRVMATGGSVIVHPASMFLKDAYLKAGGYYPLNKAQDSLLFSKMMSCGKLAIYPEPLLNYRISECSISTQTEGNPYNSLLLKLRKKMINDDIVLNEDVKLYNDIVIRAKEYNKNCVGIVNKNRLNISMDMRMHNILSFVLGDSLCCKLIITAKNLFGLYKF